MKFSYQYKTSENEKREGVVSASSREDVYRQLKAKGIHPFNVVLAPGLFNKVQSFGKRGLAIGVLCVLCLVLCAVLVRTAHESRVARREAQSTERHQLYGDPAIMEEMFATGFANVFSHPGERYLACFAQPGRAVSIAAAKLPAPDEVAACLTNEIAFAADDPREVRELKRIVNGMKSEMREYVAEAPASEYLRRLRDRQEEERMIYRRVLNELGDSRDPALIAERNKTLRELGLPTISKASAGAKDF